MKKSGWMPDALVAGADEEAEAVKISEA